MADERELEFVRIINMVQELGKEVFAVLGRSPVCGGCRRRVEGVEGGVCA